MADLYCRETCDCVADIQPVHMSIDVQPMLDQNIFTDKRVLENMLNDEKSQQKQDYCSSVQNHIATHMRKIVTEWMMDVCEN